MSIKEKIVGLTCICAYGFLNFFDNASNKGKLSVDRNGSIQLEINGLKVEPQLA